MKGSLLGPATNVQQNHVLEKKSKAQRERPYSRGQKNREKYRKKVPGTQECRRRPTRSKKKPSRDLESLPSKKSWPKPTRHSKVGLREKKNPTQRLREGGRSWCKIRRQRNRKNQFGAKKKRVRGQTLKLNSSKGGEDGLYEARPETERIRKRK